jgi:hypothetical protein
MSNRTLGIIAVVGALIVAGLVVAVLRTDVAPPPAPKTQN